MIGGDKIGEGSYGCVYNPALNKDGSDSENKKYVSKIQKDNKYANNEKKIGDKVSKIDGYINHFAPVLMKEDLKITKIRRNFLNDCSALKEDDKKENKLIMMKMEYINGEEFIEYLIKNKENVAIVQNIISSYTHLLTSIKLLTDSKIIHFDIKGDNILFNKDKEIPIIIDFGLSIDMDELINQNITIEKMRKFFYVFGPDYYVWPIEVHFICYLINVNDNPSDKEITKICDEYVDNNVPLKINCSSGFIKSYKSSCEEVLLEINKLPLGDKINKILGYWYTWDNYALSIIYLQFIYYLNITGYIKNALIIKFSELLLTNINPNPKKRLNVLVTKQKFTEFLYNLNIDSVLNLQEVKEMFLYNKKNIKKALKEQKKLLKLRSKSIRFENEN
jgi:serine/threonine protein kinase|tara:strand:- start:32 stop:1204 length:1173 start_codon:yes stop_codon:yes gene_type:complete